MSHIKIFFLILTLFLPFNLIRSQNVIISTNALDATDLETFAPATVTAGGNYRAWVTMQNTGSTPWSPYTDGSPLYRLIPYGTGNREMNGWGVASVTLPVTVQPGEVYRFEFDITAPWTTGAYDFQWRMARGDEFFGEASDNISVNVISELVTTPPGDVYATFHTQTIPNEMTAGQRYDVTITMLNTGKTPWMPGYQWLTYYDSRSDVSPDLWGADRIGLDREIAPGEPAVYNFTITAPEAPGSYNFQWRMANASGTFGELSKGMNIYVAPGQNRAKDAGK